MELVKPTQSDKYAEDFGLSDGDKVYLYEYHMEDAVLRFGSAVNNIGGKFESFAGDLPVPQIIRGGAAYVRNELTLSAEYSRITDEDLNNIEIPEVVSSGKDFLEKVNK